VDAIAPGRGDALVGKEAVARAIESTRDFVDSTYAPAARVAARGGSLKQPSRSTLTKKCRRNHPPPCATLW